jgi:anti-sigma B factor antagonist
MEIAIKTVDNIQVAEIIGEIDGKTAPEAQARILPLAAPGVRLLVDMSQLTYMSSAGLRTMLMIYRTVSSNKDAKVVLCGLTNDIKDMMRVTGFLSFFTVSDTYADGLAALKG